MNAVGLAQSTVSEHLSILKAAGVITGVIDGPGVCYELDPIALPPLTTFIVGLASPVGDICCLPATRGPA